MQTSTLRASLERHRSVWERWFPVPQYLAMPACGIDISDTSVKALMLKPTVFGFEVAHHETLAIPAGVVADGAVQDVNTLAGILQQLSILRVTPYAHAALSEEASYVFQMHVPNLEDRAAVQTIIEFELEGRVPLTLSKSIFDYDVIALHPDGVGAEIAVSVFERRSVEDFSAAFNQSGFVLLSLELEARSLARAVIPHESHETVMVVDFGRARTEVAIAKYGIPIFTRTVSVGGNAMTQAVSKFLQISLDEAEGYKNEQGLNPAGNPKVVEAITQTANALAEEINRHYQYWDNMRDEQGARVTKIDRVILCGGNANLHGLPECIASKIHAPVELADVWRNICSYDDYIPPIDREHSLGFATVVGLSLRGR